jgi:RNA-directed DNA polymerase
MAQQAKRSPARVCNNVLHVSDRAFLLEASRQTRKSRAPGVDQVTAQQYAEHLDDNLQDLHERLRDHRSVAPPVGRVGIEQDEGKQRPRGHPGCEAKMVQRAVVMMREAIVAPECHGCSPGVSKGHSQHQARHERREQCRTWHSAWIVEADVRGCFDHLDWGHLRECIQQRVREGGIVRRLGTWLRAGVLESGARSSPDKGTPQGGGISPMVSKVCLHRVLDAWLVKDGQPRMQGRGFLTRFAEDFLLGCELEADARRVMAVLPKRFARCRLTMHPEKTACMACKQPPSRESSARGTGSFDVLGFTHSWAKTRRGDWVIKRQTGGKRLRRLLRAIWTWCRENRHVPWQEQ